MPNIDRSILNNCTIDIKTYKQFNWVFIFNSDNKMKVILFFFSCTLFSFVRCATIEVGSANELTDALNSVNPGDTIQLRDGSYAGVFESTRSGTADQRITLTGSKNAILSNTNNNYGFWLKANYWTLQGFSVASSHKGIVLEGANQNILDDLEVSNIVQEGIHFRWGSSDNILRNSYIHHTGQGSTTDQGYGEGVYIGQAVSVNEF